MYVYRTALHMSELLYLYGTIDDRVRPLVFTVRKWAHEIGLTNSSPGRWITNFSLTLLVLAFLQRTTSTSPAVLPSVNTLIRLAGNKQICMCIHMYKYYVTLHYIYVIID